MPPAFDTAIAPPATVGGPVRNKYLDETLITLRRQLAQVPVNTAEHRILAEAIARLESIVWPAPADCKELDLVLEAARIHGEDGQMEHEIGDLQDLARAMYRQLTCSQRAAFLQSEEVSNVVEAAGFERLLTMRDEVPAGEWRNAVQHYRLDESCAYTHDERVDITNRYRLASQITQGSCCRYVHGEWDHYFGPGSHRSLARFVYDRSQAKLVAVQVRDADGGWEVATPQQVGQLEASFADLNDEAIRNPFDYGLDAGDVMPTWAGTHLMQERLAPRQDLPFLVELANRGNPDFQQDPQRPMFGTPEDQWVPAESLEHASALCQQYIADNQLGGGNWSGGRVRDVAGAVVARVAYNGRIVPESQPHERAERPRGG